MGKDRKLTGFPVKRASAHILCENTQGVKIKAKFGERLRSWTETAQINELLCKVLCHNLCCLIQSIYELGTEATFEANNQSASKVIPFPNY
jgi:hypothetical protein